MVHDQAHVEAALGPVIKGASVRCSTLVSRNISLASRRTSVRLEPEMWAALQEICRRERSGIHRICALIDEHRRSGTSLTAAIRVFVMAYFRTAATEEGHLRAGHGGGLPELTWLTHENRRTALQVGQAHLRHEASR
ncbi:MAG: ribbon-helix-helix domain-containing protein [Alphaproteobacteria bacterium]|nr:MAG: ribbon-helix-helix domain-containing protein [Alphaproteobacteria bacterium]